MEDRFLKIEYRGIPGFYDTEYQVLIGENPIFDMMMYIATYIDEKIFKFDIPELKFID